VSQPSSGRDPSWLSTRAALIVVLASTALAYLSTLQFKFVYDDEAQIVGNQLIEYWHYVPFYFHIQVWAHINPHQAGNYYRPIFMLWMRLNDALFGFKPWGWHLTTVLMHVLATFFVFKLARRLAAFSFAEDVSNRIGLITALIFGLHPVHIEAVAWVSGVTESLFAILLIWSFLCFLDWRENRPNSRTYSLLLYGLAILSKETAVLMMPLVFAFVWLYPSGEKPNLLKRGWNSLRASIPYFGVTFIYLYFRWLALNGLMHIVDQLDRRTNLLTIPSILWFYLKLLVAPVGLSAFYDTPYVTSPNLDQFWLPLLGISLFAAALFYWWWKTREPLIAFASVLLVLPLGPLMNFSVFFQGEIAHDRYLYTPSIGFAILVALAIVALAKRFSGSEVRLAWAVVAPIAVVFLCLTVYQSLFWADNMVLYSRGVKIAPNNNLAINNLGNEFAHRKMYPQAITLYAKVLDRDPSYYLANYNLGYTAYVTGDWKTGERFLERAAVLDPTDAGTFYYLAKCEMQLGELKEAELNLHRAIEVDQRLLGPRYTLGLLLKQEGRNKEALDYFRAELMKNPNDADARKQAEALEGK
jgi:tetratricopeptide (TPR) repeat protein